MQPIPKDAQRLADRLRRLADEVESAARFGVPIPTLMYVSSHKFSDVSFAATEHEFAAWVDYTEARVDHDGDEWSSARADCNGLPLSFSVRHRPAVTQ